MSVVKRAERIARAAHLVQTRRDGLTPYIRHVEQVVSLLADRSESVRAAAWLHDVLEDTTMSANDLAVEGIPPGVVGTVMVLTHGRESYEDYISTIKEFPYARAVKVADIVADLSDRPTPSQIVKYHNALQILCC